MSIDKKKRGGIWKQIMATIVVTLIVGGSAPWWWNHLVGLINGGSKSEPNMERTISLYNFKNKDIIQVPDGSRCRIQMSCGGFKSEQQAKTSSEHIHFEVKLNGIMLSPGDKRTFRDARGGWHIGQDFVTGRLQSGTNYNVQGNTFKYPDQYLDSREINIDVD